MHELFSMKKQITVHWTHSSAFTSWRSEWFAVHLKGEKKKIKQTPMNKKKKNRFEWTREFVFSFLLCARNLPWHFFNYQESENSIPSHSPLIYFGTFPMGPNSGKQSRFANLVEETRSGADLRVRHEMWSQGWLAPSRVGEGLCLEQESLCCSRIWIIRLAISVPDHSPNLILALPDHFNYEGRSATASCLGRNQGPKRTDH